MAKTSLAVDVPEISAGIPESEKLESPVVVSPATDDPESLCRTDVWSEIIQSVFGHTPFFISASHNGSVGDSIPFFLVRGPLGDGKLIAPPYQGFDGGFTSPDPGTRNSLIRQVLNKARDLRVRYVEIRSLMKMPELSEAGFIETTPLLISEVPLLSEAENWNNLSSSHRRNVRMAHKKGVRLEPSDRWQDMEIFYGQLARHYKSLGVPFFGREFFRQVWQKLILSGKGLLILAYFENEIIGGLLALHSGKTLIVKYSVTRHEQRFAHVNAAYALYWEAIRQGVQLGFQKLNMGITGDQNTGLREFKARFGAVELKDHFYYYPLKGSIPDYEKLYSSYKWAKQCWKMLPTACASFFGDIINRWIC